MDWTVCTFLWGDLILHGAILTGNGLHGTLKGLHGTLNGLCGTLNGLQRTLNGLKICTERNAERFEDLHGTER